MLVKLSLSMMIMNSYRSLSIACHILRIFTILTAVAQMVLWRPDVSQEIVFFRVNMLFPFMFVCQLAYQSLAVWLSISIMYWSTVMVTKQRTLIVMHNLMREGAKFRLSTSRKIQASVH